MIEVGFSKCICGNLNGCVGLDLDECECLEWGILHMNLSTNSSTAVVFIILKISDLLYSTHTNVCGVFVLWLCIKIHLTFYNILEYYICMYIKHLTSLCHAIRAFLTSNCHIMSIKSSYNLYNWHGKFRGNAENPPKISTYLWLSPPYMIVES